MHSGARDVRDPCVRRGPEACAGHGRSGVRGLRDPRDRRPGQYFPGPTAAAGGPRRPGARECQESECRHPYADDAHRQRRHEACDRPTRGSGEPRGPAAMVGRGPGPGEGGGRGPRAGTGTYSGKR